MSNAAPPPEIIRLTMLNPFTARLADPMGSAEKRSPLCGSRVIVDVNVDRDGIVTDVGMRVNACAFGQASATILGAAIVGRSARQVDEVRRAMAAWIAGEGEVPDWPGIDHLRPDRLNTVRKGSVQLAFQAAAEAALTAASALGAPTDA